ncbi:MAG TPA: iron transporter [Solirubrobacteraceae bacterium]|nr:iron transporter [Solirubrobacteraceae bacterium]
MARSDTKPPMNPDTDEADAQQLNLARAQGEAYGRALQHMTGTVADDGGEREAGDYRIGYAVEKAEGMYEWDDGELRWREPDGENLHLEISVRDRSDGRFVPGVRVLATLITPDGDEVATHEQPLLWHPMIYHYGRNWRVPQDGEYRLRVRVEPPTFMRHDEVNGCRFVEPVEVDFSGVAIERGSE